MQRVEHKKKQGRGWPGWLIPVLCAAILAVSGLILLLTHQRISQPVSVPSAPRTGGSLTNRNPDEIAEITVTQRGKAPWTLIRDPSGNMLLTGNDNTTDMTLITLIRDALANITYDDILTENPEEYRSSLKDFGLDEPLLIACVKYTDGMDITLRIGDGCGLEDETFHYMTVDGDDRLYAVGFGTVQDLNVEEPLLIAVEQPELHEVLTDRITVLDADQNRKAEWELNGKVIDPDAEENWRVTVPFIYPMDYETVGTFKENIRQLQLGTYVGLMNDENAEAFGLVNPRAELRLHFAAGNTGTVSDIGVYDVREWNETEIRILIGNQRNEMTDYVCFDGRIYTMNHFLLSVFIDTDPMQTVARYPVLIPLNSLSSLTVEGPEGSVTYELERNDDTENDMEQNTCFRNGEEIEWDAFEAAYERLLTVTFSGVLPEGFIKEDTLKKYTFRTTSGGTHTVELSPWDDYQDAVTVDGYTLFYLSKGGMTELP